MRTLPIDDIIPEIATAILRGNVVVEAPPGAGKTTRVPPALLGTVPGEILVTQPRRLAARMVARRVAGELGCRIGETVGYQVRFDTRVGKETRIRYMTEGLLVRRLCSDPSLEGVSVVILDEFHERHLDADVCLAMLRRLQRESRSDLRIVVMSATLDGEPIAEYLGATRVRSEGRQFAVDVEYLSHPDDRRLEAQVATAFRRLVMDGPGGDVLVFLPGAAEIRRAQRACAEIADRAGFRIMTLHGDLSPGEQDRVVGRQAEPKLILSTNIAETSVTIDGIAAVIDSGLARVAIHSPWSGLPALHVRKVSQASLTQRMGRAGRTREGRCLRLFTEHDGKTRPRADIPEIARSDLAQTWLGLARVGMREPTALPWLDTPPLESADAATALLVRLGAVDGTGQVTELGHRMAVMPVHPRLSRLVTMAEDCGAAWVGATAAALLSERDVRLSRTPTAELGDLVDAFERAESVKFDRGTLHREGIDANAARTVARVRDQLLRGPERPGGRQVDVEDVLARSVLAGFFDRIGRRRAERRGQLVLSSGGSLRMADAAIAHRSELLVVVAAEDVPRSVARLVVGIDEELLFEVCVEQLRDESILEFRSVGERVEHVSRLYCDRLVVEETTRPIRPDETEAAAVVLAAAAMDVGIERFVNAEALSGWRQRVGFAVANGAARITMSDDASLTAAVEQACYGLSSFAELLKAPLLDSLRQNVGERAELDAVAPTHVQLISGRRVLIHYEADRPPWIASRLQDFFGMTESPSVARGQVPLVIHLLAPNQRPVQVTTDLAGFWARHYPSLRKQLGRRYPKHAWPDDPTVAQPGMRRRGR